MGRGKIGLFDRFRRDNHENHVSEVPISTIQRWYLYDLSIPNPNEIAVSFGLNPVSDEGHSKEVEDSEERLALIHPYIPYFDIISDINAKAIMNVQLAAMDTDKPEYEQMKEDVEIMQDLYQAIGFSALVSAFSSGFDLGVILPGADGIGSYYKEYEDE